MPFKDEHREVYDKAIRPACELTGFKSLRVDEVTGVYNINRKIIEYIFNSDAIIADLSDWNPNVFYEIGVAHAIDNKTIMIIEKKDKVPFDVSSYSCMLYDKTDTGLNKLQERIAETLEQIEEWRKHPTNPVQDFKPHDAFVLRSDFEQLQNELRRQDSLLKRAIPKSELAALKQELRAKEKLLAGSLSKQEIMGLKEERARLQKKNKSLQEDIAQLRQQIATTGTSPALRSEPLDALSLAHVKKMLQEKDFYDADYHDKGRGSTHKYRVGEEDGVKLVRDENTGLTWQQSGSSQEMRFEEAQGYIDQLNQQKYAGSSDWRLPTLEEAMSLMEPEQKSADLHIDPVFDKTQRWIWTADKKDASVAWYVHFFGGLCNFSRVVFDSFVRAVR